MKTIDELIEKPERVMYYESSKMRFLEYVDQLEKYTDYLEQLKAEQDKPTVKGMSLFLAKENERLQSELKEMKVEQEQKPNIIEMIENAPSVKIGIDDFYGKQSVIRLVEQSKEQKHTKDAVLNHLKWTSSRLGYFKMYNPTNYEAIRELEFSFRELWNKRHKQYYNKEFKTKP